MKYSILILVSLFFLNFGIAQTFPGESWDKIKSPYFSGWDPNRLSSLEEYIIDSTATTALLVIQDGKVVYQYGDVENTSYIASCRKSILSMLYGKYVENGVIDLQKTLNNLDITYDGRLLEQEKEATIKDIISSRSGIYLPAANGGDMVFLAPPRGTVTPGDLWIYNNWDFNMAGYIFEKITKKNIYDELNDQFAQPMQFEDWDRSIQVKDGDSLITDVLAYHFYLSARDMARLGLLMLNEGKWNDNQILPSFWVREMTNPSTSFEEVDKIAPFVKNKYNGMSYGYMWWLFDKPLNKKLEKAYSAQGAYGQNISIIPNINTVVVIKANNIFERQRGDHSFILNYIANSFDDSLRNELEEFSKSLGDNDIAKFVDLYSSNHHKVDSVFLINTLNKLAYYYLNDLEDIDNALLLFELNVRKNPFSWLVYDGLAEVYYRSGNYKKSLVNYQKALDLNIDNEWGNNSRVSQIISRIKSKM